MLFLDIENAVPAVFDHGMDFLRQFFEHVLFEDSLDDLALAEDDALTVARGDSNVSILGLTRAVDHAPHHGDANRLGHLFEDLVDLVGEGEEVDFDPATGGAGDHRRALLAEFERLEDLVPDEHFFGRIGGQRDADRVTNAHREQCADPDCRPNGPRARRSGFSHPEVERVVVREGGKPPICLNQHRDFERLERNLGVVEVEVFQDLDVTQGRADQPLGAKFNLAGPDRGHLVDEVLRHRGNRAEVDTDPDRRAALLGLGDHLANVLFLADVARVQAEAVDTSLQRLEGQGVLEVDVGDERHR